MMISVEKSHPNFAWACHAMRDGESAYAPQAEIPYDLHRYRDGWYAFWKSPPNGQLGRRLRTKEEMVRFLQGNPAVGVALRARKSQARPPHTRK